MGLIAMVSADKLSLCSRLRSGRFILSSTSTILLIGLMLWSMWPWFFWNHRGILLYTLSILFIIIRITIPQERKISLSNGMIICSGFFLLSWITFSHLDNVFSIINFVRQFLVLVLVLLMTDKEKNRLVKWSTNTYALILFIAILFYLPVALGGISLPYRLIEHPDTASAYPKFENYIFLILRSENVLFHRFQGIFTEPGHVGMVSALFLYINRYNLKKPAVLVIFIAGMMSFSLAAYLLMLIGYFLYNFFLSGNILKKVFQLTFLIGITVAALSYIYIYYNDSLISEKIISRLIYDEEKGVSGNNRTSKHFDYYYDHEFFKKGSWISGIGPSEYDRKLAGGTSSYKVFFVQYGIIGFFLLLTFYFLMAYYTRSRIIWGLLLLYCFSFWQRPYALWEIQLFLFICSTSLFNRKINPDPDYIIHPQRKISENIYRINY